MLKTRWRSIQTNSYHIDPHVHCRDGPRQSYKATISSVMKIANSQRVIAICDMPNTDPPIISKEMVEKRIRLAREEGCFEGYYLYIGITDNPMQIQEAAEVVESNPRVVGIKMYAGRSVGDLAIVSELAQAKVYEELSKLDYDGVLVVHCEKESLFNMKLWNPDDPKSWNLARPIEAEVESVRDQIKFATRASFRGVLHITHVSAPETVEIIKNARRDLRITCGATPHHLTYSTLTMEGREGLLYKVNPPVRDYIRMRKLRNLLKQGEIDWIETDHAPHTIEEKMQPNYMSGIQSLNCYSAFLDGLRDDEFTERQINALTYENIKKVFRKVVE